jgi:hypothetical protein
VKTEDLRGCIEVARAQGWGGMAEEADDELTQLEGAADATWNAAIEAAADLMEREDAAPVFCTMFAKRLRSLKRGQS